MAPATISTAGTRPGANPGRVAVLAAFTVLAAAAVALLPRIPQDVAYHLFADRRSLLVPNGADVLSNLGFLVAGLAGLAAVRHASFADRRERGPWLLFFGSVALVAPGSAWYHLAPSNASLVWDRLPMAAGFAALFVAVLAERVAPSAARLLLPAAAASVATVLYWAATEAAGAGDLRPYLLAQYLPMVALPLVLALFPRRSSAGWVAGLALYALAKVAESKDAAVFAATWLVSGHTLKHLLAAAAVGTFAAMIHRRRTPPHSSSGSSASLFISSRITTVAYDPRGSSKVAR